MRNVSAHGSTAVTDTTAASALTGTPFNPAIGIVKTRPDVGKTFDFGLLGGGT